MTFDFLNKIQLLFQIYLSTRHEEHLLFIDVWMQTIDSLNSYKPCIIYNSNLPTYSLHIVLL
jgi:hypothetical protein